MVGRNFREHANCKNFSIHCPGSEELDLRQKADVFQFVGDLQPDLIIHAAGKVGGISSNVADPFGYLLENLEIGANVISAAVALRIPKVINLASSCIYPKDVDGHLTEEMLLSGPLEPTNEGYALAKIAALRLCQFASSRDKGLLYKTLIPCNLYGRHDKFTANAAHLLPAIIAKVHDAKTNGAGTVEIWGDGTARREFMYAGDLADALGRAIDHFDTLPAMMNIGIGSDRSVLDYYAAVARVVGWQGEFTFDLSRPTGMRRKVVDVSRQTSWGWAPQMTLDAGIRATYEFFLRSNSHES